MSVPYINTISIEAAHKSDIYAICTTPKYTITAGGDGNVLLWSNSAPNEEPTCLTSEPMRSGIHHISSDPDGKFLIAVAFDSTVVAFDLTKLQPLSIPNISKQLSNAGSWACALSANSFCAISTLRGAIFLLNLKSDEVLAQLVEPGSATTSSVIDSSDETGSNLTTGRPCLAVDISPDRQFVVGAYESGRCRVFRVETSRVAFSLPSHITRPRCVKFNPSGTLIAVTGDESIALFTLSGGSYLGSLLGHDSYIYSIAFDQEGTRLISVAGDGKAKVWSLETRETIATISENSLPLFTCDWVPTRSNSIGGAAVGFVCGGVDRTLTFFREATGGGNELGV